MRKGDNYLDTHRSLSNNSIHTPSSEMQNKEGGVVGMFLLSTEPVLLNILEIEFSEIHPSGQCEV